MAIAAATDRRTRISLAVATMPAVSRSGGSGRLNSSTLRAPRYLDWATCRTAGRGRRSNSVAVVVLSPPPRVPGTGDIDNDGATLTLTNDTLSDNLRGWLETDAGTTSVENTTAASGDSEGGDFDCVANAASRVRRASATSERSR